MKVQVRRGFTLVELLVVIAIIAVLASLLFGRIKPSKQAADNVVCRNNCASRHRVGYVCGRLWSLSALCHAKRRIVVPEDVGASP